MGYCKKFDELFEADSDHAAAVAAAAAGRYTFMCRQDDNAPLSPVAVEESIFDEVIRLARSMVVDDGNNVVHRQVLPMTVEIVISENEEEMSARTSSDSRVDEAFPALPEMDDKAVPEWAISQVIGGLERVALESCSVKPPCTICLDAILMGNRMPCSHIYHGYCIYRWLRKSNWCPTSCATDFDR